MIKELDKENIQLIVYIQQGDRFTHRHLHANQSIVNKVLPIHHAYTVTFICINFDAMLCYD